MDHSPQPQGAESSPPARLARRWRYHSAVDVARALAQAAARSEEHGRRAAHPTPGDRLASTWQEIANPPAVSPGL